MRTLTSAVVFAALASSTISLLAPPVQAAVLTTGQAGHPANPPYGGFICADVSRASTVPGTPITAYDCTAGPNEQFEFNGATIYALGGQGCVDIRGGSTAAGTPVQFWPCNGTAAQQWYYENGEIYNPQSNKCLDATTLNNGQQLVINSCDGNSISQNWRES